jgi:hypothetical protein
MIAVQAAIRWSNVGLFCPAHHSQFWDCESAGALKSISLAANSAVAKIQPDHPRVRSAFQGIGYEGASAGRASGVQEIKTAPLNHR